jgi:hypothetical protein
MGNGESKDDYYKRIISQIPANLIDRINDACSGAKDRDTNLNFISASQDDNPQSSLKGHKGNSTPGHIASKQGDLTIHQVEEIIRNRNFSSSSDANRGINDLKIKDRQLENLSESLNAPFKQSLEENLLSLDQLKSNEQLMSLPKMPII